MTSVRVPFFRPPVHTDGALWMWWMLAASLLRAFGALDPATIAMVIGVLCFARWSWSAWRFPSLPPCSDPVDGVCDGEVFAVAQVLPMVVMIVTGDLPGASFALLITVVCVLRAWSWQSKRAKVRPTRFVSA